MHQPAVTERRSDYVLRQGDLSDRDGRSNGRSRSTTAHAYSDRYKEDEPPMLPPERPAIRSTRTASSHILSESPQRDVHDGDYSFSRPNNFRSNTFEGPTQLRRESSPIPISRTSRVPSDSLTVRTQRSQLRSTGRTNEGVTEPSDESIVYSSPDRSYDGRSASPATSFGSTPSRSASYSTLNATTTNGKKQAPPPPPSRGKKPPPPPPPPMKRSALSTTNVSYA